MSAEENGLRLALTQLGWTLGVGLCCWTLFAQAWLRRVVLVYPESLLLVAALLLLLGVTADIGWSSCGGFANSRAGKKSTSFAMPWQLKRAGVLGLNRRITRLMLPLNPRARYPLVDDKSITKSVCAEHGIPTPAMFALIDRYGLIRDVLRAVAGHPEFVVKPARGAGGRRRAGHRRTRRRSEVGGRRSGVSQRRQGLSRTSRTRRRGEAETRGRERRASLSLPTSDLRPPTSVSCNPQSPTATLSRSRRAKRSTWPDLRITCG